MLGPQQIPLAEMWGQNVIGARCLFFFENHVVTDCGGLDQKACDTCEYAYAPVLTYFCVNCLYNIYTMLVIKHGSATLSFLVATLRMPLSSIAFSSVWLMGADAVQPSLSDFISLIVIISGLVAYRIGGRKLKENIQQENPEKMSSPSTWLLSDSPAERQSPGGTLRRRATEVGWKFVPMFMSGVGAQPVMLFKPEKVVQPRSAMRVRTDMMAKLGVVSPLHSPKLRNLPLPPEVEPEAVTLAF